MKSLLFMSILLWSCDEYSRSREITACGMFCMKATITKVTISTGCKPAVCYCDDGRTTTL